MKNFVVIIFILLSGFLSAQEVKNVKLADETVLDSLIADRGDKFLLVNIWATWCIPCREEFPDLVKLKEKFSRELEIVAISVDYADEIKSKVIPFLNSQNVNFPVLVSNFRKDEDLINYFSMKWNGALPATFIYDNKGTNVSFLEGKQSYDSFSSLLNGIL